MHRILLGILALCATAALALVAVGTTRHAPSTPVQQTLVILEGLPEPAVHARQLRIAVVDLDLLHSIDPLNRAQSRQQAEDAIRNLAGHIAFRRPDILVLHNLPLDGPATREARTLQTLAVHTDLPWQTALPLHNRRFLLSPTLPPNMPSGRLVAGTALLSRFPIEDVTGTTLPFDHRHGTFQRLFGSQPGRLLVRLRIGPDVHHHITVAIHDQAPASPIAGHESHESRTLRPDAPTTDAQGPATRDAPSQADLLPDESLPPSPAALSFARFLHDPAPSSVYATGSTDDTSSNIEQSPPPDANPDLPWTTHQRSADGLLLFAAAGWRPMITDPDVRIPGLPHPMLLLEIERPEPAHDP